ncbi:unnamed protein product [Cylicocyclus nassatus]|uniref:Coiled-coil domain-containing protein n=1 Tax=Cylicocyclus nassatus TaxID=53992 RepID=A0AA36H9E6_CYLNA|nr:unnamed protein product [Cylicocyclus nassatus]
MEAKKSVAEVAAHLREIEDYNLAFRLQEEEYMSHYNRNREGRRLVGDDTKQSIAEQAHEDEAARQRRLEALKKITETDEEIARRLQQEFEEEEKRRLEELARRDAEIARRLAEEEGLAPSSSSTLFSQPTLLPEDQDQTESAQLVDLSRESTTPDQSGRIPAETVPGIEESGTATLIATPDTGLGPTIALHPTNPFLQDLTAQQSSEPIQYYSEFGLPPPSDLALGRQK